MFVSLLDIGVSACLGVAGLGAVLVGVAYLPGVPAFFGACAVSLSSACTTHWRHVDLLQSWDRLVGPGRDCRQL